MTTLAIALAKIAVLEARLDALEAGRGGASTSNGSSSGATNGSSGGGEALPDHMLDNDWADSKIDKDPPKWKGRSQVNRWYSDAPPEWLRSMAGFFDWKADKGRKEVPVRLQSSGKNAGKPWHEADTFKAKLLRAWAIRNERKAAQQPRPGPAKPPASIPDDEFPFGANAPVDVDDGVGF
jgi:hypothetical protein